jgi:hypothetical protein
MEIGPRRAVMPPRPFDLLSTTGRSMTDTPSSVSPLVAALNTSRTRLGDPWRGTYHVSIETADVMEATTLANALNAVDVCFQTNYRRNETGRPEKAFLTVYKLDSLRRLLDGLGDQLDDQPRQALDALVRARGPVPLEILRRISESIDLGRTYAQVAQKMNELRVVDGMGGRGWTVRKVRAAEAAYEEQLRHERASQTQEAGRPE